MTQGEVDRIKVDGYAVGIVGLREAIDAMASEWARKPDEEVRCELLARLSKRNYIPDGAKERYAKAFLREFKRRCGIPFDEDLPEGLEIKILGQGCTQCDRLEQEVMAAVSELGLQADIEHVRDLKEIGKYGVLGAPALIVNGKVKCVGKTPPRGKLVEWLKGEGSA
jgi:small redox-active disulfide protein 2